VLEKTRALWSIEQATIVVQSFHCGDQFSKPAKKSGRRRVGGGQGNDEPETIFALPEGGGVGAD